MKNIEMAVQERLFQMQDLEYKAFQCKLMPNVAPERVIGVRTPELRKYARELSKQPEAAEFMLALPHKYYEELNLHGLLVETIKDYNTAIKAVSVLLPHVDNWATCDLITPKVFGKHLQELMEQIKLWIASGETYTVRFGVEMLMNFYLGEAFDISQPAMAAAIESEEYYVKMMVAWYFATALAKQKEAVMPFFTEKRLPDWTHNKAIQKAMESFRIDADTKAYLRTLKVTIPKDRS